MPRQIPLLEMYEPFAGKEVIQCQRCHLKFASRMGWKRHLLPSFKGCQSRDELMTQGWRKKKGVWMLPQQESGQPPIIILPPK